MTRQESVRPVLRTRSQPVGPRQRRHSHARPHGVVESEHVTRERGGCASGKPLTKMPPLWAPGPGEHDQKPNRLRHAFMDGHKGTFVHCACRKTHRRVGSTRELLNSAWRWSLRCAQTGCACDIAAGAANAMAAHMGPGSLARIESQWLRMRKRPPRGGRFEYSYLFVFRSYRPLAPCARQTSLQRTTLRIKPTPISPALIRKNVAGSGTLSFTVMEPDQDETAGVPAKIPGR